ncbi:MAG: hypothetical protein ACYDAD_09730 [Acidimicrobiales bacterium]
MAGGWVVAEADGAVLVGVLAGVLAGVVATDEGEARGAVRDVVGGAVAVERGVAAEDVVAVWLVCDVVDDVGPDP